MKYVFLLAGLLAVLPHTGHTQTDSHLQPGNHNKTSAMTTTQQNKEVILRLYEQALNRHDMTNLDDYISDEFAGTGGVKGPAAFAAPISPLIQAFPDIRWNIGSVIAEGDQVAVNWKLQGTHRGEFNGFVATGKKISNEGMAIYTLKNGKVTGSSVQTDRLGFLQELQAIPRNLSLLPGNKGSKDQVSFIDKFFVPAAARREFYERMNINRQFIRTLPGFIGDAAYEYSDADGNLICVTVALWQNREVLMKAKETVQAEYKKQGFDAAEMFKRLNITVDRGIYTPTDHY